MGSGQQPAANVESLLHAAAMGRIGVDRRFVQSILDTQDPAGILRFARGSHEGDRIDLQPLLVDLLLHFKPPDAFEFFLDTIRQAPEDVDDALIQALLPFGEKAVGPLIELYEELGEEQGSDVAFLLSGLRVHDPRLLPLLLDRLEYDAADGAFCLGLYGDQAARAALEKLLSEIPEEDSELRREVSFAIEQLDAPATKYEPEPFDILADYPKRQLPAFDLLDESERIEMLKAEDPDERAGAAYSFFNTELNIKSRTALLAAAQNDSDPTVRGRAWASLSESADDAAIRSLLVSVLNDESKPVQERGGAAVGLYGLADQDDVRPGIEALYELGGQARAKALEAMWRSLWEPYAKYFAPSLDETDFQILRHALRGAGYFQLTRQIDKIASFFDREEPYDDLREDALFAYALAMPGETTRGRVRGMLRKIDSLAELSDAEMELVEFALDERLRLHGLTPVFAAEKEEEELDSAPEPPPPPQKVGRNDPCPCGSGKKFKKCCGA